MTKCFLGFCDGLVRTCAMVNSEYQAIGSGYCCHLTQGAAAISFLVAWVIGSLAIAGLFPLSTVGWCALGLGGGALLLPLAAGKLKERKITLIYATIGALFSLVAGIGCLTGAMTAAQSGWIILAFPLGSLGLTLLIGLTVATGVGGLFIKSQLARPSI